MLKVVNKESNVSWEDSEGGCLYEDGQGDVWLLQEDHLEYIMVCLTTCTDVVAGFEACGDTWETHGPFKRFYGRLEAT